MITETIYYTLTMRYFDFKLIECYEVLASEESGYVVRIVYIDGEEEIAVGDLMFFNIKYQITEVKILTKTKGFAIN